MPLGLLRISGAPVRMSVLWVAAITQSSEMDVQ
jgi:hypothetical protein